MESETAAEKKLNFDAFLEKRDPPFDSDKLLGLAKCAESLERYDDMCIILKKLVEMKCGENKTLEVEERNMLSVAYKNRVGAQRASWRTLNPPSKTAGTEISDASYAKYKAIIEEELKKVCQEVIGLLGAKPGLDHEKGKLLTGDIDAETKIFYLKMAGDYCRYLAEINDTESKDKTETYYKAAMEEATSKDAGKGLPPTHPTRLGLALNFSVCYYEILGDSDKACQLAKQAFDDAIEKLDTLQDASYKDSTLIMQLLRDNLTLWTNEKNDKDEQ